MAWSEQARAAAAAARKAHAKGRTAHEDMIKQTAAQVERQRGKPKTQQGIMFTKSAQTGAQGLNAYRRATGRKGK